jgi:hypothetical protein
MPGCASFSTGRRIHNRPLPGQGRLQKMEKNRRRGRVVRQETATYLLPGDVGCHDVMIIESVFSFHATFKP